MEQNQESSLFGLSIDTNSKAHLAEAARWAKFLAIIGFIVCGLVVVFGIFFGTIMSTLGSGAGYGRYSEMQAMGSGLGAMMAVLYILIALLYFFPTLFLYRFATKAKAALASNDQETLNVSFQNLKKMFRFVGILTLIVLSFYAIAILIGIVAAGASRF
ncbi:MAG: hypothetical protein JSU05_10295 [Bacteroidetes bacterium]|nr:hypothetical protein [Bacteroidota bacterium]